MILSIVVFFVGLVLSAFFSGSETGFYRVPRLRLVIDGVAGDRISQAMLWASNNPAIFVATALVGNNVANYLTSLAVVRIAGQLFPTGGLTAELLLTLAITPVVFIIGELMPKKAFLDAPYRLLRLCTPLLGFFGVLFAPISCMLWLASRLLSWMAGTSIEPLRMILRRNELEGMFEEGQAVGILSPAQRDLAQATFTLGGRSVRNYMIPLARQVHLTAKSDREAVLRLARRSKQDALPIKPESQKESSVRILRASRCLTHDTKEPLPYEMIPSYPATAHFLKVITELESNAQPLAALLGASGQVIGYVRLERLQMALLDGK